MKSFFLPHCLGVVLTLLTGISQGYESAQDCEDSETQRYVFSWPIGDDCKSKPRGGTSKGGPLTFATKASNQWQALQQRDLSKFERDRQAILAMQGGYKVSFDFLETLGFAEDYEADRPYQSWGTEYVYLLNDESEFISLQHVMVMVFEQESGELSEPMVMKHWRQDWRYQDTSLLEYQFNNQWEMRQLSEDEVAGKWTQAVFQVDDSPRYESLGEWQHNGSFSSWRSAKTRRPLPRREYSVRDDYDVLEGYNTHVITRLGWRQVEENWKLDLDEQGKANSDLPYLAKEEGMARYQPIVDFDFGPGDKYMELAGRFWADVRAEWQSVFLANPKLSLKKTVDNLPIFLPLFEYAESIVSAGEYDEVAGREFASATISQYVSD